MGVSNLKVGLQRKLASWSGEQIKLDKQIEKITSEWATLAEKQERFERLQVLIDCSNEIMAELEPGWDPESVKPSIPNGQKLPYPPGMATRWALDLIRLSDGPFSSLEIAKKIVADQGGDIDDYDLVDRLRAAVDASLRGTASRYVKCIQQRPTLWVKRDD